jgi:hypothetical protein
VASRASPVTKTLTEVQRYTPLADLMVVSPNGEMFLIDVKGLYRTNPWIIKRKPVKANLFYVLAFVPAEGPNQFFVMSQEQAS